MRRLLLVCYDIRDGKRLRKVFQTCKAYADHIQYSVFRAQLTSRGRAELTAALEAVIHHGEDQVLLVDLGPADNPRPSTFQALGCPYEPPDDGPVIV